MKLLVIFSLFVGTALCEMELGAYNYEYSEGPNNRREMRYSNGTMEGDYTFVDETGLTHEVRYTAGANQGFRVISHLVTGNGQTVQLNTDHTPEVQAARDTHIAFQNYLWNVHPQLSEEELPPVVVRHVPSPVKNEPNFPIIPLIPPQKIIQQQVQVIQHAGHPAQQVIVVKDGTTNVQYGVRPLAVENVPTHVEVNFPVGTRHVQYVPSPVHRPSPAAQTHHTHHVEVVPQIQHVHVPVQKVPEFVQHAHVPVQDVAQFVHHAHVPVQEVAHFVQHPQLIAQDVQLVNGFTPEVAQATQQHLSHVAAIKAVLPNIQT